LLNLTIKDIDLVILSHLHFDHAGGLKLFRKSGVPILIQKEELNYAYNPDWFYKDVYFRDDFDFDDIVYENIYGDFKVNDEIKIITLPGHTPGIQGIEYKSENNKIIFTSDAIYTLDNIKPDLKRQGFDYCTSVWGSSAKKVLLRNRLDNYEIYPGHDPKFYSGKKFAPYIYKE
jgi:glyoxylase-like metal-dependent hydrolase (beta-lactamase superfamily II)